MTITPIIAPVSSSNSSLPLYIGIILLVVVLVGIKIINSFLKNAKTKDKDINFTSNIDGFLLTKAEFEFYSVLIQALKDESVLIFAKVRLGDLVKVTSSGGAWGYGHNESNRKHIDFVICEKDNSKILFALELDDKSHDSETSQKADDFKNVALEKANIPFIRMKVQKEYNVNIIKETLVGFLNEHYSNGAVN
jgi:hypothetical protein